MHASAAFVRGDHVHCGRGVGTKPNPLAPFARKAGGTGWLHRIWFFSPCLPSEEGRVLFGAHIYLHLKYYTRLCADR